MRLWASFLKGVYYKCNDLKIGCFLSIIPDYWSRYYLCEGEEIVIENDPSKTEEKEDEKVKPETASSVEANSENITNNVSGEDEEIGTANIDGNEVLKLSSPSACNISTYTHIQNNEEDVSNVSRRSSKQSSGSVQDSITSEILKSPRTSFPPYDENFQNDTREDVNKLPSDTCLQSGGSKLSTNSEILVYSTLSSSSLNEAIIQIINGEDIAISPHSSESQMNDTELCKQGEDLISPGNNLNSSEILSKSSPELSLNYKPDTDSLKRESNEKIKEKLSNLSNRSVCSDNEYICPTCFAKIRHVHFHEEMNQIHSISLESGHILAPLPRKDSKTDLANEQKKSEQKQKKKKPDKSNKSNANENN